MRRRSPPPWLLSAVVLAAVACIGLTHLAYPFGGDQALFDLGARAMKGGAALYRDFWDVKQPGIFLFFLAGGSLFGFTAPTIHLFELIYLLAFSATLQWTLRGWFRFSATAALVPLLIVGLYYANADPFSLTQVEALAGFPLYLSLYFALRAAAADSRGLFVAAGAAGAISLCFKLLFAPVLAAIWLAVLLSAARSASAQRRSALFAGMALMVCACAAGTAGWIAATMAVSGEQKVVATFFTYPLEISRSIAGAPLHRFVASATAYAEGTILVIALAAVALIAAPARDALRAASAAWIAGALFVIVLQRQSWWQYQFQLLGAPLGILSAYGLEQTFEWARAGGRSTLRYGCAALPLLALLAAPAKHFGVTVANIGRARLLYSDDGRPRFAALIEPSDFGAETRFLHARSALPGPIYVCGNPNYYLAANRKQAVSINGWALELLLPAQWTQLYRDLSEKQPPYIFVSVFYQPVISQRSPEIASALVTRYRLVRRDAAGSWYERRAR